MAYIVLAAGAVMALLGALAIGTGYPIIQIERGWATVIAGSTLLAGGFVTMAVGLMLRALMDMRSALTTASFPSPTYKAAAPHDSEPAFGIEPHRAPNYGAAALGAAAVAVPVASLSTTARQEPDPEPRQIDEQQAHPATEHDLLVRDHHDEPPAPVAHEPAAAPPMDDWLDKAFASLALESSPTAKAADHGPSTRIEPEPSPAEPLHAEHVAARHDGEILYADEQEPDAHAADPHEAHDDEAAHDATHREVEHEVHVGHEETAHAAPVEHHLEPMAEPAPAPSNDPAVIGRYEADGTSYTMFADGSIEAQSDAGIYRFASMADLKAFIEG